jgi:alpha-ketoglutarate-dependent taurine dioxygenase
LNWIWPTTAEVPDKATVLTARQVSENDQRRHRVREHLRNLRGTIGGKAELGGVRAVHSFAAAQLLVYLDPDPKERAAWDRTPSRVHPLVWTRGGSGKKSMVLGSTAERIVGKSEDESKELLGRLLEWPTQDRFTLRHRWRVGDLVIWDNTGMLHRACPYGEQSARLMLRTSLVGEEVVQ